MISFLVKHGWCPCSTSGAEPLANAKYFSEHFSERNLADSSSLVNDDVRMSGTPIGLVIDGGMGGIK